MDMRSGAGSCLMSGAAPPEVGVSLAAGVSLVAGVSIGAGVRASRWSAFEALSGARSAEESAEAASAEAETSEKKSATRSGGSIAREAQPAQWREPSGSCVKLTVRAARENLNLYARMAGKPITKGV